MQKIIKIGDKVTIILNNGNCIEKKITDEEFNKIVKAQTDNEIISILNPEFYKIKKEREQALSTIEKLRQSKILRVYNNAIYWDNVSSLSVPIDLANSILDAEFNHDYLKITTYRNFWTLMSLNTNEECRNNLYWFLQLYGLKLAKCGFFVAYRNVDTTPKEGVYTDYHSHSTVIKIGEVVTLDRNKCDCDSSHECSRGLHCASAKWLKKNYYGNTGIACLVNPADVVAVPHNSEYGKLRTCAYLPMKIINYDGDKVIPLNVEDGFDCSYVTKVIYEGIMGTETDSAYKIKIPELPGTTVESIQDKLLEIAKECITQRKI